MTSNSRNSNSRNSNVSNSNVSNINVSNSNVSNSNVSNSNLQFLNYVDQIATAIGLDENQKINFKASLNQFNDNEKYKLLTNTDLANKIEDLINVDERLKQLIENNGALAPYRNDISSNWNKTISELAKLQALSIIQKVNKNDCAPVVNELLNILNSKLGSVNNIIESGLQEPATDANVKAAAKEAAQALSSSSIKTGGGNYDQNYKQKYLKYKQKYLELKNNL